jgi:hypothetical protein
MGGSVQKKSHCQRLQRKTTIHEQARSTQILLGKALRRMDGGRVEEQGQKD